MRRCDAFGEVEPDDDPMALCPECGRKYNPYAKGLGCPDCDD